MLRRLTKAGVAVLGLFHVWLLVRHASTGQLVEPALVARWLVAVGLLAALVMLRRQGASIFTSRKGIAVWLLAAALHGPSIASRVGAFDAPALPEAAVSLVSVVASVTAIGLGVVLIFFATRRTSSRLARFVRPVPVVARLGSVRARAFLLASPRPPPLA